MVSVFICTHICTLVLSISVHIYILTLAQLVILYGELVQLCLKKYAIGADFVTS